MGNWGVRGRRVNWVHEVLVHKLAVKYEKQGETEERSKEKLKKEAGHSKLVGGSFNKLENSYTRLVLGTTR